MCAGLVGDDTGIMGGRDTEVGVCSEGVYSSSKRMGGKESLLSDSEASDWFWHMEQRTEWREGCME